MPDTDRNHRAVPLTDAIIDSWRRDDGFVISTDKARLDVAAVHGYLSACSYWAKGVPRAVVERAIAGTPLVFGVYEESTGRQVGFARVITDRATMAYLSDVFIVPDYQGRGLGTWLIETIVAHPELRGLRRWLLATADAHGLYARFGFTPLAQPDRWMERHFPDVYDDGAT